MGDPAIADREAAAIGHPHRVQMLFDAKASAWPAKYAPGGRLAGRLAQLAGAVSERVGESGELLDLGCGSGNLARHLAAAGYRVIGCDIAQEMLRRAEADDRTRAVRWVRLDPRWRTLPFASAGYDAVVAASVLEYVTDPATVLGECARVLRPGGTLLCTVPDMAHPVRWLEWPLGLVARLPFSGVARRLCPGLGPYLTYLRVSRHRRPVRWWQEAAQRAGLRLAPLPAGRAPLRLLVFTRPGDSPGPCSDTLGDASDDGDT